MTKRGFYSRLASDEITTHGYRVLTSAECTTIMIAELVATSGLGSSFDCMGIGCDWFGESVRLCINLCLLLDNNLCLLLNNSICLLLDNNIGLRWDYVFCWTSYLIGILGSSTLNFHLVNRMLITCESSISAFLHLTLLSLYLIIIPCISLFPALAEYQS
jgi:hypothetical protein